MARIIRILCRYEHLLGILIIFDIYNRWFCLSHFPGRIPLKKLSLGHNKDTEIWHEQFSVNYFPRLTVLDVREYGDILVAIPSFMLQALHNLEELHVGDCSSVKEEFQLEGLDEKHQAKLLRQLRILELWHLPGLTHLWKENNKPGLEL